MATQTIENFNTLDLETLASVEGEQQRHIEFQKGI